MPELILKSNDSGEEFLLSDRTTLGRFHENDIVVNDYLVSRHHCVFYQDGSDFIVKDLESSNGTFLNDQLVHQSKIAEGDRLRVGSLEFNIIVQHQHSEKTDSEPQFNSIIFDPYFRKKITGIHVRLKQTPSTDYFLERDSVSTVGRMSFCNIPLNNAYVSRNNATIDVREHRVMIADASSKNGTYVNGERIINTELSDGDTFNIAGEFDFDVTFEYDQHSSLRSVARIGTIHTVNILDDIEKILEFYNAKYGDQVLLEVERQAHVFCSEVEALLDSGAQQGLSSQSVSRFLHGVSRAVQVMSGDTVQRMSIEKQVHESIQPVLLREIAEIMQQQILMPGLLYFEGEGGEVKEAVQMNGLIVGFRNGFQLVLFGLPIENLLYMIYAASWLIRIRLCDDKTV